MTTKNYLFGIVTGLALALSASIAQADIHVGPDGTDSPTCGSLVNKCRSISQGISNAKYRDTVNVFPGVYGDLNHNGVIGEPGEEFGAPNVHALIVIDKAITVLSERGAESTIIDARGTGLSGVRILHKEVKFGYADRGFTLIGSGEAYAIVGYWLEVSSRIWGNRIIDWDTGISARDCQAHENDIINTRRGMNLQGNSHAVGNRVSLARWVAIYFQGGTIAHNVVVGSGTGIVISRAYPNPVTTTVTHNAIIDNSEHGVHIFARSVVIADNDIIGNGWANGMNCGVYNYTDKKVYAPRNYWGRDGSINIACDIRPGGRTVVTESRESPLNLPVR